MRFEIKEEIMSDPSDIVHLLAKKEQNKQIDFVCEQLANYITTSV